MTTPILNGGRSPERFRRKRHSTPQHGPKAIDITLGLLLGRRLLPPAASLLSPPERAKRAVLVMRKVQPFFVRAAFGHRHGLDPVLGEELLKLPLHLRAGRNVRAHPPLDDRLGIPVENDLSGDLDRRLIVGAVVSHGAGGGLRGLLPLVLLDGCAPLGPVMFRFRFPYLQFLQAHRSTPLVQG